MLVAIVAAAAGPIDILSARPRVSPADRTFTMRPGEDLLLSGKLTTTSPELTYTVRMPAAGSE